VRWSAVFQGSALHVCSVQRGKKEPPFFEPRNVLKTEIFTVFRFISAAQRFTAAATLCAKTSAALRLQKKWPSLVPTKNYANRSFDRKLQFFPIAVHETTTDNSCSIRTWYIRTADAVRTRSKIQGIFGLSLTNALYFAVFSNTYRMNRKMIDE
jgi:hypothetical protein